MELTLEAQSGRERGSGPARRLRAAGRVPGVVYGAGVENTPLSVVWTDLRAVLNEGGQNALVSLHIDGEEHLAIIYDLQRDPVKLTIDHVDFLAVERGKPLQVEVAFRLEGRAEKVSQEGAVVEQQVNTLTVLAPPRAVPAELVLDITEMTLDRNLTVADLVLPDEVELVDVEDDQVLAVAKYTRATLALDEEEGEETDAEAVDAEASDSDEESDGEGDSED